MLSLESIEQRLDNPKAYYVFYEYFYKAAVGETWWKDCMEETEERIGNDTTEAFALLLFANNYKAWLYEEKRKHGDELWTEYENLGEVSILDMLLCNQEFNLEDDGTDDLLVCVTTNETYKNAVKARKEWLSKLKQMPICSEMKRSWNEIEGGENIAENGAIPNQAAQSGKKIREKKKGN